MSGKTNESEYFDIDLRLQGPKDSIDRAIDKLDKLMTTRQWEDAKLEAISIQKRFAGSSRVSDLTSRVRIAREHYKSHLEKRFNESVHAEDVERAMHYLKEMDKVLTPEEARPFAHMARQVIEANKKRMAMQLRMAVHLQDWIKAAEISDQIQEEYPNSRMASEARALSEDLHRRAEEAKFEDREPSPSWA
jgi:hypothetical protein